ncbi:MAG: ankyrin repeat domain-containing protein [Campylobacterota bacterium]|nr:ankyrin repeat domain-containing protein [Campylobacterota bacterium]
MIKKLFGKEESPAEAFEKELLKKESDINSLEKILKNGNVNINHQNQNGETFLHLALKSRKIQKAVWLLSKNIKADIMDNDGLTAFDIAVNNQNHRIVRTLINTTNVTLNKKDKFGRTILQDSIILGDHEMAKILLENGADINSKNNQNRNVIYDAVSYGNLEFIEYLLSFDNLELNNIDTSKDTILNHKTVKRNDNIAIMLIENGADPTIINSDGKTYLSNCALIGIDSLDIINTIIKCGFDINSKIANGNTILMEMIDSILLLNKNQDEQKRNSLLALTNALVKKGLNFNKVNHDNETVLFKAVRSNDDEIVKFLLEFGINVNNKNNKTQTALSIAVSQGIESFNIIVNLLRYKADPSVIDTSGKTLFEVINNILLDPKIENNIYAQYTRILKEMLFYNKKDLNFLDSTGDPLFYKPLISNNITIFKMYTKAGLDIYQLNKDGHNLFFEYVVKVFEDDNTNIDFQSALSILISSKVDHNMQDETGWTAVSKIIATTPCNLKLFKTLVKVAKFDYTISDKLGRTPMHSAVWKGRSSIIRIINFIDPRIKDIPDNYGILPLVYAALLGNQEVVLTFVDIKAKSTISDSYISQAAIKKFKPMLKNLATLTKGIDDSLHLRQINKVIQNIRADFQ